MFPNLLMGQMTPLVIQPQAMTQQATRHARRVYVGGLPPTANEQTVAIFFNGVMAAIGGNTAGPGDAVLNVYINHDKKFAFVEMRSVEEASNAMALDGIMFEGAPVKVRRPTDYNPSLAAALGPSQPNPNLNLAAVGLMPGSAGGLEGPDRIFVGGLPYYFAESQVRELLESFGPLRGFDLVKDRETGNSKGYAFCVYQDLSVTDIACAALNGIKMGDKTLTVRRANQGASQPRPEQESILLQAQQQVQMQKLMYQVGGALPTKVVCLLQDTPSWLAMNTDYSYTLVGERGGDEFVRNHFAHRPEVIDAFERIPNVGMKSDLLRYLILEVEGGVYTDTDTIALKPIDLWIPAEFRDKANLVVGIEFDRLNGGAWTDINHWVQFCQWTIAAAPGHPVFRRMVNRILRSLDDLSQIHNVTIDRVKPSSFEVMNSTGPAAWTDMVFEQLQEYEPSLNDTADLSGMTGPVLYGDVLVLTIDGFGMGQAHSKSTNDGSIPDAALVKHNFRGSWRGEKRKK